MITERTTRRAVVKKLTAAQAKRKKLLLEAIQKWDGELTRAVAAFDQRVEELYHELVATPFGELDNCLQELEYLRQEIHGQLQRHYERFASKRAFDRHEKWTESASGKAYFAWWEQYAEEIEQLEEVSLPVLDLEAKVYLGKIAKAPNKPEA
jgi:uncharacterized membrane protein YccC